MFKKGEAVVMHSCIESEKHPTKIWFCASDAVKEGDKQSVLLEGYEGSFAVEHLAHANPDRLLELWHESDSEQSVIDYLGLTFEQYARWVETAKLTFA